MFPIRTAWRERVDARVALLRGEVKRYRKTPERKCIRQLLREVEEATTSPSRFGWWTGAPIERSWRKIHDAEILLVSLRGIKTLDSGRPELVSLARAALPEGDAQRVAAEKHLTDQAWTAPLDGHKKAVLRAQYAAALRSAYDASDEQYARLRSFRNIIVMCATGLVVLAAALGVLGGLKSSTLSLCFSTNTSSSAQSGQSQVCPADKGGPSALDVPLVEGLGVLGAAVAATIAIRGLRGTSAPYAVPVALAALKLPAGAVTAFIGVLILRAKFVAGLPVLDSQSQILIYAILFGYAQQIVTGLIDRQAQVVIGRTPTSEPSAPS